MKFYQRIISVIPTKQIITSYPLTVREGFFFGFHDKNPWSPDNQYLLAHKFDMENRMPYAGEKVEVGFFEGPNWDSFRSIGTTQAWNWQTGAMLQWVGNKNEIIFNDFNGESHIARLYSINGELINIVTIPVAAVSPNGAYALSHSFNRLRIGDVAYGYQQGTEGDEQKLKSANEKLIMIDIKQGIQRSLLSLDEIIGTDYCASMEGAYHFFTHCLFSPSSERFVFLHRWVKKNKQVFTRMFACNIDGTDLFEFPTTGMVSHICWTDSKTILAYARTILGDQYYLFRDKTGKFEFLDREKFTSDGHPQCSSDGTIITDTYPDRFRYQTLIKYDSQKSERIDLAKLKSPFDYTGDVRCDLHPRWDRTSKIVCFDSAHTGIRSLCTMVIEE